MKAGPKVPMPWDVAIFFSIATLGLGYSVQRVAKNAIAPSAVRALAEDTESSSASSGHKTLDLGCVRKKLLRERLTLDAGELRLKGRFCHLTKSAMAAFQGISVKNLTTAQEATIFFEADDTTFGTDFIPLVRGRNLIRVEWRESLAEEPRVFVAEIIEE